MRSLEQRRLLLDQSRKQPCATLAVIGYFRVGLFCEEFERGAGQAVGLHAPREDAEARLAARDDLEQPELGHVPFGDTRKAANFGRRRRAADLRALADQADAEWRAVAQAGLGHLHVALLEDAQRQAAAREQHDIEGKQSEILHLLRIALAEQTGVAPEDGPAVADSPSALHAEETRHV